MENKQSKQIAGKVSTTSPNSPYPIHAQEGQRAVLKKYNVAFLVFGGVLFLIFIALGAYYLGFQKGNSNTKYGSANSSLFQPSESKKVEDDPKLLSPVDDKKLEYNSRLTVGLYIGETPVDIFYEQYGDPSEGRIAVYHAWNQITNRNEGAFVVDDESQGSCLNKLIPITKSDGMRFVTEYICGDLQQIKVTSLSFKPTQNIMEIKVENLDRFNLLNDYFSSVHLKSFIKVIGWQDFDHLLVDQISYLEDQLDSTGKEKHEIYLFDVNDKSKKLIHTIEQ